MHIARENPEIVVIRHLFCLILAVAALSTPAVADTLKVMGAGSLRAAVTDLLHRFPLQSDTLKEPEFGPSGLLHQKIENGAAVDILTSAGWNNRAGLPKATLSAWSFILRATACARLPDRTWASIKLISSIDCSIQP
jgi:ABC-type molybdate transport system substrate-binding protein